MALNQWFKFYGGEYLSDPKISALTPAERSCWLTLLSLSSISSTPGKIEYLTREVLLQKSGIVWDPYNTGEWDNALSILDKLARMKMISLGEEGSITVLNWEKRQDTALTNAERQAKYRKSNEKVTDPVTKVTLDKIRIDKIREDKREDTPSEIAKSFFEGGEHYDVVMEKLSSSISEPLLEKELKKFALYWTEPNKSGTKVRWEQQATFDVYRRIVTWFSRITERQTTNRGRGFATD